MIELLHIWYTVIDIQDRQGLSFIGLKYYLWINAGPKSLLLITASSVQWKIK